MTYVDRQAPPGGEDRFRTETHVVQGRVGRRTMLGGLAAIGAAGLIGASHTVAQEATPDASDSESATTDKFAEAGERYQFFVAQLAVGLGQSDVAAVDAAIRAALRAVVEDRFAAGEISRNDADALISQIDTSVAPIKAGFHRGRRIGGPRDGRSDDSDGVGGSGEDDDSLPTTEATPTL
jgi:hypothetical protein